ncbi:MAG: response regulator transcription factor [Lachnospiraceae bacterium]|nr:response regulator transcription factor [Lachnospiraceae bacterium]
MRILICDDDELVRRQIHKFLRDYFKNAHLSCPEIVMYENGELLLKDTGDKDIVFLDVEMPGLKGIHVGQELQESNPRIIIIMVSAFPEYLDDAMRFHVFRYLSKPLEKLRFFQNMKDALQKYNSTAGKVVIECRDKNNVTVSKADIIAVETAERKIIIHTVGQKYESTETMTYWREKLQDKCFITTHKSFIVNMMYVISFTPTLIQLENEVTAYLTKRKYKEFKRAYLLYVEGLR